MSGRGILIAGIGNLFHGDDYFGCEVAQRLAAREWRQEDHVEDFGIRGYDVAYAIMRGYDAVILVDATQRGGEPGTVYVIEPDLDSLGQPQPSEPPMDAHSLNPAGVLRLVQTLGGDIPELLLVGCEPADLGTAEEGKIGLSAPVAAGVEKAVAVIESLVTTLLAKKPMSPNEARS